MTSMYRYLEKVNSELARRYQHERWIAGSAGKGHDCPNPMNTLGFATGSHRLISKFAEGGY